MLRPFAITLAALITAATVAYAEPVQPLSGVRYSDLDLSTDAGASALVDRLNRAAYQACKYPIGTVAHRRCMAETVAKSVAAINAPVVTKQYLAHR